MGVCKSRADSQGKITNRLTLAAGIPVVVVAIRGSLMSRGEPWHEAIILCNKELPEGVKAGCQGSRRCSLSGRGLLFLKESGSQYRNKEPHADDRLTSDMPLSRDNSIDPS